MEKTLISRATQDLLSWQALHRSLSLKERLSSFKTYRTSVFQAKEFTCKREVLSPSDREVTIVDPYSAELRPMLMFASNNYLGLGNHPYVCEKVKQAIDKYGVGVGGPPLLNGYTFLMREVEERLASFKHKESALIFPSGFAANLGIIGSLVNPKDCILYDEHSHASFYDGLKMNKCKAYPFPHNKVETLARLMDFRRKNQGDMFVGAEGIYSMSGDMAPLPKLLDLCRKHNALFILDDAHGTGVVGKNGAGTADYFGVSDEVDVIMGTFSKAFTVTGGFVAGSKDVIEYMRYFARPYIFSAALPPPVLAAVLAGLEVMQNEPWLQFQLLHNVQYALQLLRPYGLVAEPQGGIIALKVPEGMNIRKANFLFHQLGLFISAIEYPAVPLNKQMFRISLMAQHTKADIDFLSEAVAQVWSDEGVYNS